MRTDACERGGGALESEPDLEALYVRYHQFVRGALRKHYVDPRELEDVTQQVFLVLLRRVDEATERQSTGAWLYQIARRVAASHVRAERRRARKHGELEAADVAPATTRESTDPEERYAREQAWSFIREFLESLDEEACAVFVMSEIEGLRGVEIAARLRITLPMTYARIRSVRARFDRRLARKRRGMLAGLWAVFARSIAAVAAFAIGLSPRVKAVLAVLLLSSVGLLAARWSGGAGRPAPSGPVVADRADTDDDESPQADADAIRRGRQATGAFDGIVVDVDGAPISGAVVCADRTEDPTHRLDAPPACTTSDRAGSFRIPGALVQAHTLEAMARGFLPAKFRGRPTANVRIVMHKGGVELAGVVSDVHGGPVDAAWVAVENRVEPTLGATVRTDENGAFSLWVAEGPVSLASGAAGYASHFSVANAPSTSVRLELGAESVIAGVVVDAETGAPLPGIRVGALLDMGPERYANRGRVAYSDVAGRWEIRGLLPDRYVIDAVGERRWGRGSEAVDLGIGDHADGIRVEMVAGVDVVGRIFDAQTGVGCVDGHAVTLDRTQSITREGSVDGDGWVAVGPLTGDGVSEIVAACRGYASRKFEIDLRDGGVPAQEWALSRGSELVVRVVDPTSASLQDWVVELAVPPELRVDHDVRHEMTDAMGSVVLDGLLPGAYHVLAHAPDRPAVAVALVHVGVGRSDLELRPATGKSVIGTVVGAGGEPIAGALVALQRDEPPRSDILADGSDEAMAEPVVEHGDIHHAMTDEAGAFRFASVAASEYGVWVLPADAAVTYLGSGHRVPGDALRTVTVGDREVELDLRLGRLSSISGVVRDEEGDVVMDARVFAVREHEGEAIDPRGRARLSDAEGHFRVGALAAGTYSLVAYRPGGGVARRSGIEAGAREVDLVIPRVGSISGTVVTVDGSIVEAYSMSLHGGPRREHEFVPTGPQGRFIASGLEAGSVTLHVEAPEGSGDVTVELGAGENRSGIEITLEPQAQVTGRLVDRDNAPVVGSGIVVREITTPPGRGEMRFIAKTSSDGSFRGDVPPGTHELVVVPTQLMELEGPEVAEALTAAPALRTITSKVGETVDVGALVMEVGR